MRVLACVAFLTLSSFAFPSPTRAGEDAPLDAADRRAFAWFDGLLLPSVAGLPFVRVTVTHKDPAIGSWTVEGFLAAESSAGWRIRGPLGGEEQVHRDERVTTVAIDRPELTDVASKAIDRLRDRGNQRLGVGNALALARRLAERGLEKAAHDVLEEARRVPPPQGTAPGRPLEEVAAEELAVPVIWRIVLEFGDPSVPRTRLLEEMRAYARGFPTSKHRATADEAVRLLAAMVAEDATHAPPSEEQLDRMPGSARVAEWIFQLRDQHGLQFGQPGSPSIFLHWSPEHVTSSPGARLRAMGYEAVPALIEALVDERFTRTVGYWRDFTYSHYVVRVGDAAREILEHVTRRYFFSPTYTAASMVKDGMHHEVQAKYRAWWAEAGGFLPPLKALASETDPRRREALARALPDRGPGLIVGAPEGAAWGTGGVVRAVPGLSLEAAKELLRTVLTQSPFPRTKAMAAWALWDLGEPAAVSAITALWRSMDEESRVDPLQGAAVASFLASCGDPEAVRTLFDGLDEQPPGVRELVVLVFARGGLGAIRGLAADSSGGIAEPWRLEGVAADRVEDGLVDRLFDLAEDPLGLIPRQAPLCDLDPSFDAGRRIADAAIRVLSLRWPVDYAMEAAPAHSAEEWEAMRVRFLAEAKTRAASRAER